MSNAINADAKYLKVILADANPKSVLIDMNDIAKIGIGDKAQIPNDKTIYTIIIIDWKVPYSEQWTVLVDDDGLKVWEKFIKNIEKDIDNSV